MVSVRSFHKYRGEKSFTLSRLIRILEEQLPQVAPPQTKYKVTDIPTARTIRYYIANSLVDKPASKEGGNALYGYRHLLQILAIKYLQAQYLPLLKIKSLVENADNRELEILMPSIAPVTSTHRGIAREDLRVTARSFLLRKPTAAPDPPPPASVAADATAPHPAGSSDTWHRVEVGPGIELHVHAGTLSEDGRERLRGALLKEIGVMRGWFAEGKP